MALGGQGAPLVPAFHRFAFGSEAEDRALVNIGVLRTSPCLRPRAR